MPDTLRYGILGAGGHSKFVNRLLTEIGDTKLVAVCDTNRNRATALAEPAKATVYTDFDEMIALQEIDMLVVCIPPFAHTGQEITAAEKGIHLYIAKPVAMNTEYAQRVSTTIERNNVLSCVTYGLRYVHAVQKVRELLAGRQIALAEGYAFLSVKPGGGRPSVTQKEMSRGQMFIQACHVYDIFRYLIGEVEKVSAIKAEGFIPRSEIYNIEDAGVVTLKFASGAVGQVSCTVMAPSCVSGQFGFRITARDILMSYVNQEGVLNVKEGTRDWNYEHVSKPHDYEAEMLRRFLYAIRTGDTSKILTPYSDAVRTLQIAIGVIEALETGRTVEIPMI